jgi:hypothetical protein
VQLDVVLCRRCAGSHEKVEFRIFELGDQVFTHWGYCPATGEPLLLDLRTHKGVPSEQRGFVTEWLAAPAGAKAPPEDPDYPNGKLIEPLGVAASTPACLLELPYPAPGVGHWKVTCLRCHAKVAVRTAGRKDDPHSVRVVCKHPPQGSAPAESLPPAAVPPQEAPKLPVSDVFKCGHPHRGQSGGPCGGLLEETDKGLYCRHCGGAHHFDGTPKTVKSLRLCCLGCCGRTSLPPDTCVKCGGQMRPGKAILPEYGGTPEWGGSKVVTVSQIPSKQPPADCMKCSECGHSYQPGYKG